MKEDTEEAFSYPPPSFSPNPFGSRTCGVRRAILDVGGLWKRWCEMKQQKCVDLDQLSLRPQEEGALPPPPPPSSTSSTGGGAGTWDLQLRDKLEPLQAHTHYTHTHTHTHFLVRVWLKPAPRESCFKVARWASGPESP